MLSVSLYTCGSMGLSKCITAFPAVQLYHSLARPFLATRTDTVGSSSLGGRVIQDRHHYHGLQIADGDTGLPPTQDGVTFGLSPASLD